jgi:hypothetical protein
VVAPLHVDEAAGHLEPPCLIVSCARSWPCVQPVTATLRS